MTFKEDIEELRYQAECPGTVNMPGTEALIMAYDTIADNDGPTKKVSVYCGNLSILKNTLASASVRVPEKYLRHFIRSLAANELVNNVQVDGETIF